MDAVRVYHCRNWRRENPDGGCARRRNQDVASAGAPASAMLMSLLLVAQPVIAMAKAGPFYSLYLSPLGLGRTGFYFPHDELADVGLATGHSTDLSRSPYGAAIGGEAPPVFQYYFEKFGRADLHYVDLSSLTPQTSPLPAYLVIEDGRKYIENIAFIRGIESPKNLHGASPWDRCLRREFIADTRRASPQLQVATNSRSVPNILAGNRPGKASSANLGSGRQPAVAQTRIAMSGLTGVDIQLQE